MTTSRSDERTPELENPGQPRRGVEASPHRGRGPRDHRAEDVRMGAPKRRDRARESKDGRRALVELKPALVEAAR